MPAAAAWESLDGVWRRAFELAWEAVASGNIGVGAVVATADGEVVAAGRNRVADAVAPQGEIAGSSLAHAEVNALARVPFRTPRSLILTTTLQPCLQCAAAIRMAPVATVRVAGADPLWDGCGDFTTLAPWVARRPAVPVDGPRGDEIGLFGTLLSRFGLGLMTPVEEALRVAGQGDLIDLARRLEADGTVEAFSGEPVDRFLAAVWPHLATLAGERRSG